MKLTRSLGIVATATLLSLAALAGTAQTTAAGTTVPSAASRVPTDPDQMAKPVSQSRYERSMIEWVYETFTTAGIAAPDVAIRFSVDESSCEGNRGTVRKRDDDSLIVRVCASHPDPTVRDTWRRRTLVHEISHVWIKMNLDAGNRTRFVALRGLNDWNDRSDAWANRAVEHAAEVITWGVGDDSWRFVGLPNQGCREMEAGYRMLTGLNPARDTASCS